MKIKMPYITIKQRSNIFYLSKISALDLKKVVDFHFREPYKDYSQYKNKNFDKLMEELNSQDVRVSEGIRSKNEVGSIQRTLDRDRVYDIKDFIYNDETAFFPSSVLISIDTSKSENDFELLDEYGVFEIDSDVMALSVIDGQHRLAGIFLCEDSILRKIEVPVVFLLDISIATASILFQQINGKQKQVNKSNLFDLFDNIDNENINDDDDMETKNYHLICQSFFFDSTSPLYRQIKMLGTGSGAISQAFFIESCKTNLNDLKDFSINSRYDILYDYFRKFQEIFPLDWPVPINSEDLSLEELDAHATKVLKERKSQLAKTNGFGAILKLLSYMLKQYGSETIKHLDQLDRLKNSFDWTNIEGTGKKSQTAIFNRMKLIVFEELI